MVETLCATQRPSRVAVEELPERIFLDGFEVAPVEANLVINEVDYVQPAIDEGEFINLYNPGPDALSLVAGHIQLLTFLPRPCRR